MSLLEARQLAVEVAGHTLLEGLDVSMEAGSVWGLLGANGSGKTTLLHTLAGLLEPSRGEIRLADKPLAQWSRGEIARRLALLTQDQEDSFPASVIETVLSGRHPHLSPWASESAEDLAIAQRALADMDLAGRAHGSVHTLSGGERQRVALAALRCQQTPVALLDEPSNHLDLRHQVNLLSALCQDYRDQGGAILMSLHDINLAARFCDHVILLLGEGRTAAGPAAELLTESRLSAVYQHPIRALETAAGRCFIAA